MHYAIGSASMRLIVSYINDDYYVACTMWASMQFCYIAIVMHNCQPSWYAHLR